MRIGRPVSIPFCVLAGAGLAGLVWLRTPTQGQINQGLSTSGPTPWIDVTAYGAKGDAKLNLSGSIGNGSNTLTVSTATDPGFSAGDVGKSISINGAGIAAPTGMPTATTSAGTGGLLCGMTVNYEVTALTENTTNNKLTSESPASPPGTPILVSSSCSNNNGKVTITPPTLTGATGFAVYASYAAGVELYQPVTGTNCSGGVTSASGYGCPVGATWNSGSSNLVFDTAQPPVNSVFTTTITAVTPATTATILDLTAHGVTNGGHVAWGTDNAPAVALAINACIEAMTWTISAPGCTVFFPGPTAGATGRYFLASGVTVNLNPGSLGVQNLSLVGGGSFGTSSGDTVTYPPAAGAAKASTGSAEIVGSGRFPLLTFGQLSASNVPGVGIINLGFRDVAGNTPGGGTAAATYGNTWGGVRLINVIHPYLERLNAANFGIGYGIEVEGDPTGTGETQAGQIVNSNCALCRIGIWGPQNTSDIQVQGGTYSGSGAGNSYGADFESISTGANTGSIRITGTAFRNHSVAAVKFFDCQACQVIGIKGEQVMTGTPTPVGTAISIDGTTGTGRCAQDAVIGGGFANYTNPDVTITNNCSQPIVLLGPGVRVMDNATSAVELSANGMRPGLTATPAPEGTESYDTTTHVPVWALNAGAVGRVPTFSNTLSPGASDCVQWVSTTQIGDFLHHCMTIAGDLGGSYDAPTVVGVNGVSYPSGPGTNTVPVVTATNTVTYEAVPPTAGGVASESSTGVGGFWAPVGVTSVPPVSSNSGLADTGSKNVPVYQFTLPYSVTITKADWNSFVAQGGTCHLDIGIYNSAGTLLVDTGTLNCNQASGATSFYQNTLTSTTLSPGVYYFGWSADGVVFKIGSVASNQAWTGIANLSSPTFPARFGTCASTLTVGNVLPATCGTIAPSSFSNLPVVFFEP